MGVELNGLESSVELLPASQQSTVVSDELNRILVILRETCPEGARISFDFDGTLHVHIDVRKREDATVVQTLLPKVGAGLFQKISLGGTPHHPFFHRVSAHISR
jgi:hypothetical protein